MFQSRKYRELGWASTQTDCRPVVAVLKLDSDWVAFLRNAPVLEQLAAGCVRGKRHPECLSHNLSGLWVLCFARHRHGSRRLGLRPGGAASGCFVAFWRTTAAGRSEAPIRGSFPAAQLAQIPTSKVAAGAWESLRSASVTSPDRPYSSGLRRVSKFAQSRQGFKRLKGGILPRRGSTDLIPTEQNLVAQNKVANWLTKLPKAWTCVQESCQLN